MKHSFVAAASAVAVAALGTLCAPAHAVQVTWYVTGHMLPALPGTPTDLMTLAPNGALFTASFSFDSASGPLVFDSTRTDFVTTNALAATAIDVAGSHFGSAGSSRIIEYADANGEQLILNGGSVAGPKPSHYSLAALDVLQLTHFGPSSASPSDKWPWFSPFGVGGAFAMVSVAAPPDLTKAENGAKLDLFFYEPTLGSYFHRQGAVEAIATTPFAVPEPASWLMMLGGGLLLASRRRCDTR